MRFAIAVISTLILVGCDPQAPDSGAGVGFDGYDNYQQQREDTLAGAGPIVVGAEISDEVVPGDETPPVTGKTQTATAPLNLNNPDISDEQDFGAVSSRESIESDAERLTAQKNAYQVIAPTALPTRSGGSGATVVEFALSTTNAVGQTIYRRSNALAGNRFDRNCAKYTSADRAQEAFLKAGGPKRDPKGLDPDGDGFACYWDPAPYRFAVAN